MAKKKLKRKKIESTTLTQDLQLYGRLLLYMKRYYIAFFISLIGFGILAASQPLLAKMMELITAAIQNKDVDSVVTIYNLSGAKLISSKESILNLSAYTSGVYFVQVEGLVVKVVKN